MTGIGSVGAARAETPRETVTVAKEMEFDMHDVQYGDYQSPVATFNDSIYTVWVDSQLRTMIARKAGDGSIATGVIFETTKEDKYHVGPSVGIDKKGYIHVTGNMHGSGHPYGKGEYSWKYKVSDKPEDISSFTLRGTNPDLSPPGMGITYPFFNTDNNGELYLAFRHRVSFRGWVPGIGAGGIARYDTETERWSMLGGSDYKWKKTTLFWVEPEQSTAYQGFKTRLFFDNDNCLHTAVTFHTNEAFNGMLVVYACSPDGGVTWQKADGAPYATLPITLKNADVVTGPPWTSDGKLYNLAHVGVTHDGRPIVSFRKGNKNYWCFWQKGMGWSAPTGFPATFPARFVTDCNGVVTAVGGRTFSRSFDNGATWQTYTVETGHTQNTIFDYRYLAERGDLRYQTCQKGMMEIWTARFSGGRAPAGAAAPK